MQRFIPLLVLTGMLGLLAYGLSIDPSKRDSVQEGKPAPDFTATLLQLDESAPSSKLSLGDLKGKVWVLNAWASWCGTCRAEHQALNEFAKQPNVLMVGLNYKDNPVTARKFLKHAGNPYTYVLDDRDGKIGFAWGLTFTPTTLVIDKQGYIRYEHVGEMKPKRLQGVLKLIEDLDKGVNDET